MRVSLAGAVGCAGTLRWFDRVGTNAQTLHSSMVNSVGHAQHTLCWALLWPGRVGGKQWARDLSLVGAVGCVGFCGCQGGAIYLSLAGAVGCVRGGLTWWHAGGQCADAGLEPGSLCSVCWDLRCSEGWGAMRHLK